MPLDLSVPPIIIEPPRRRTWMARLIEAVLILGIMFLGILTLAPLMAPLLTLLELS